MNEWIIKASTCNFNSALTKSTQVYKEKEKDKTWIRI